VDLTNAWLAEEGHLAPLRRLVGEGSDTVIRSLKARAKDATAS
jgi:aminopeptidase N